MSSQNSCRCCLTRPPDRNLKSKYTVSGKTEIYADMLKECFEIHLCTGEDDSGICEICITRLRDAIDFKEQVQRCQKDLMKQLDYVKDETKPIVKEEVADYDEDNGAYFIDLKDEIEDFEGLADEDDNKKLTELLALNSLTVKRKSKKKLRSDKKSGEIYLYAHIIPLLGTGIIVGYTTHLSI